mmetsp:Transcript_8255/g.21848  ORF Transcript_8255/g.21848 Transcript_8255/m.21848 type:complete len:208 (+) Transcript_8255:3-626(+)
MFVNVHFCTVVGAGVEQLTHSTVTSSVLPRVSSHSKALLEGSFGAAASAWDQGLPVNSLGMSSASCGAAAAAKFTDPHGMSPATSQQPYQSEDLFIGFGEFTGAPVTGSPAFRTGASPTTPWTSSQIEDMLIGSIGAAVGAAIEGSSANLVDMRSAAVQASSQSEASLVGNSGSSVRTTAAAGVASWASMQDLAEVLRNAVPDFYED